MRARSTLNETHIVSQKKKDLASWEHNTSWFKLPRTYRPRKLLLLRTAWSLIKNHQNDMGQWLQTSTTAGFNCWTLYHIWPAHWIRIFSKSHIWNFYPPVISQFFLKTFIVKSIQECWCAAFVHDWEPPLLFIRVTSNFLCICSTIGAHAQEDWCKSDKN